MATAISTTAKTPRDDERIYHPLQQLRGIIRRYVLIEGVLSVLLFLVAWFTIALLLDFGLFKATGWDWVRDGSWNLRATALGIALLLVAGILAFRIVRRLTVEFSNSSLALVLERRFPQILGDRLITAVELADVEKAEKHGYSAAMIRRTITEARERVGQTTVNDVFNWRRLWLMAALLIGWVIALAAGAFAAHAIASRGVQPTNAAWNSAHVVGILAERDVLLKDTPWPRRALLELQDVPETGVRVASDGGAPRLRVKAYRWVIVDRNRPDGWRPLMWSDVTESFVGVPVPALPTTDSTTSVDPATLPADAILEDAAVRGRLSEAMGLEQYQELQKVFDRLEELAAKPSYGRTLRKLEKPEAVTFKYIGLQSAGDGELKSTGNNEFAGDVTGLKENVIFTVRAEDYRTPERAITLVPPPALMNLIKKEYQPAYLHYASPYVPSDPADPNSLPVVAGYSALAGLRQRIPDERLSTTGDRTVFVVPVGSEVVITGVTEQPIAKAFAIPKIGRVPGAKPGSAEPVPVPVGLIEEQEGDKTYERGTFTLTFGENDRVVAPVEFDFVFENSDGIRSSRQMMIQVTEDQTPIVEVIPEVIRKVGKEYWVTPKAKIPFNPESNIRDDAGLSKVSYAVKYQPKDAYIVRSLQLANYARGAVTPAVAGNFGTLASGFGKYIHDVRSDDTNARKEASFLVYQFHDNRDGLDARLKRETLAQIKKLLPEPTPSGRAELVKRVGLQTALRQGYRRPDGTLDKYKWVIEGDFFDIGGLQALQAPPGDVQPRYEMLLSVQATDTNFDTGPRVGEHEPITLMIVSESDLLTEIGKDEERLGTKLDEALKKLDSAKAKYEFVRSKADVQRPDEIEAVKVRSKDALQDIAKARDAVQAVSREFRRIERECIFNQLEEKTIAAQGKLANRLDRILDEQTQPVSEDEERYLAEGRLTPQSTFKVTDKLIGDGQTVFDEGRWPDSALVSAGASELSKLYLELAAIRQSLGEAQSKERLRNLIRSIKENQERISLSIRDWSRRVGLELTADTPQLGTAGPFFLTKGETKKIRQTIKWRQYKEDTVKVKLVASDPSIIVPAEITLDFEKNDLDFEYEVRAGTKEGDFVITLTPASGDKVVVSLSVK